MKAIILFLAITFTGVQAGHVLHANDGRYEFINISNFGSKVLLHYIRVNYFDGLPVQICHDTAMGIDYFYNSLLEKTVMHYIAGLAANPLGGEEYIPLEESLVDYL